MKRVMLDKPSRVVAGTIYVHPLDSVANYAIGQMLNQRSVDHMNEEMRCSDGIRRNLWTIPRQHLDEVKRSGYDFEYFEATRRGIEPMTDK